MKTRVNWTRVVGWVLVLLGLAGIGWGMSYTWLSSYPTEFAGTVLTVAGTDKTQIWFGDSAKTAGDRLQQVTCPVVTPGVLCITAPSTSQNLTIWVQGEQDQTSKVDRTLRIIPRFTAALAGLGTLLVVVGFPWALFPSAIGAWANLLVEGGGGYSLSKFQLMIWFGLATTAYMALAAPKLTFLTNVPDQVWMLMGLSGATSILAVGGNPTQSEGNEKSQPPNWLTAKTLLVDLQTAVRTSASVSPEVGKAVADGTTAINNFVANQGNLQQLDVAFWQAWRSMQDFVANRTNPPQGATEALQQVGASRNLFTLKGATESSLSEADRQNLGAQATQMLNTMQEAIEGVPQTDSTTQEVLDSALTMADQSRLGNIDPTAFAKTVMAAVERLQTVHESVHGPLPDALQQRVVAFGDGLRTWTKVGKASDLVENWNGEGDLSRYQYLVVTLVAATLFLVQLFRTLNFPQVPQQFLFVVGSSQLTYLGVKYFQRLQIGK